MDCNKNLFVYLAAITVNLMSIGAAVAYGWTSPCLPKLNGDVDPEDNPLRRPITILEESWITSSFNLGGAFYPIFIGITGNRFGRKSTLLIFSLPMVLSNVILIFANTVVHFYVARFLVGLGMGCVYTVIPLYLAEISNVENRGFTTMTLQLMVAFTQLCVYIIGPFVTIKTLAIITLIPLSLFIILFGLFIPESPYFLVLNNEYSKAAKSLAKFRQTSPSHVHKELAEIIKNIEDSKTEKTSFKNIFNSDVVRKSLFIVVGLMLFQQFTGVSSILPYLQSMFNATKTSIPSDISVMIVGLVQLISIAITSTVIDRIGRKKILICSNIGVLLSLTLLGSFFFFQSRGFDLSSFFWLPITSIVLVIITFSFGMGPLPWTIAGEIFPSNLKTNLNGITTFSNIVFSIMTTMFLPSLSVMIGMAWCVWLFALFSFVSLFFIAYIVPETRGRSFLEIQFMLREGKKEQDFDAKL